MAITTFFADTRRLLASAALAVASATAGASPEPSSPQYNYLLHCGGCHIEDGSGMTGVVPDLNEHMGFFASFPEGRAYLIRVPGSAHSPLRDEQLAEVLNWMLGTFAAEDSPQPYTADEVTENRRVPMYDAPGTRKELLQRLGGPQASLSGESLEPKAHAPANPEAGQLSSTAASAAPVPLSQQQLQSFGAALFFDTSLSRHENQSCASCHDPARAFSDARPAAVLAGASIGSDDLSVGQRNAPALTYIGFNPALSLNDSHSIVSGSLLTRAIEPAPADAVRGGFFWDGREATLEAQVLTPFINPKEMALADLPELAARVRGNVNYQDYLAGLRDQDAVIARIADALAAYLRSDALNAFDSRYDRYLRGEYQPTREEMIGMGLFFAPGFTSCATCHQSESTGYAERELFTNHRYENIGSPLNKALLSRNELGADYRDTGLAANPAVSAKFAPPELAGRIKVPSLRNVAVTGPYMHNGVFSELSTLMAFYNHFNETGNGGRINPETGEPWAPANYPDSIARHKLESGFPLNPRQIKALTAFLHMLTDARYE
jgi:cytochrome c peroxidase